MSSLPLVALSKISLLSSLKKTPTSVKRPTPAAREPCRVSSPLTSSRSPSPPHVLPPPPPWASAMRPPHSLSLSPPSHVAAHRVRSRLLHTCPRAAEMSSRFEFIAMRLQAPVSTWPQSPRPPFTSRTISRLLSSSFLSPSFSSPLSSIP